MRCFLLAMILAVSACAPLEEPIQDLTPGGKADGDLSPVVSIGENHPVARFRVQCAETFSCQVTLGGFPTEAQWNRIKPTLNRIDDDTFLVMGDIRVIRESDGKEVGIYPLRNRLSSSFRLGYPPDQYSETGQWENRRAFFAMVELDGGPRESYIVELRYAAPYETHIEDGHLQHYLPFSAVELNLFVHWE